MWQKRKWWFLGAAGLVVCVLCGAGMVRSYRQIHQPRKESWTLSLRQREATVRHEYVTLGDTVCAVAVSDSEALRAEVILMRNGMCHSMLEGLEPGKVVVTVSFASGSQHEYVVTVAGPAATQETRAYQPEEALPEVRQLLGVADHLFGDAEHNLKNCSLAMEHCEKARQLLRGVALYHFLSEFRELRQFEEKGEQLREKLFQKYATAYDLAISREDSDQARRHLQRILELIPDPHDRRHCFAKTYLQYAF